MVEVEASVTRASGAVESGCASRAAQERDLLYTRRKPCGVSGSRNPGTGKDVVKSQ